MAVLTKEEILTATNSERAVIEAARAVFSERHAGIRPDRLYALKTALDRLELEYLAIDMDKPTMDARFRQALLTLGAVRAEQAYNRIATADEQASPAMLAAFTFGELLDVRQAGPSAFAAWAAALEHIGSGLPIWARDSRHAGPYFTKLASYRGTLKEVRDGA
jgi:hypothetical protein